MAQSEPINGKAHSRSKMYDFDEYKVRYGITDDLPPAEKLEKLHDLFARLASCTRAISDNLQPEELQRRLNDESASLTQDTMEMLFEENVHAIGLLRRCVVEMGANPKNYTKGNSKSFAACVKLYAEEEDRLELGRKEWGDFLAASGSTDSPCKSGLRPVMTCLMVQMTPLVLAFEEMIAA